MAVPTTIHKFEHKHLHFLSKCFSDWRWFSLLLHRSHSVTNSKIHPSVIIIRIMLKGSVLPHRSWTESNPQEFKPSLKQPRVQGRGKMSIYHQKGTSGHTLSPAPQEGDCNWRWGGSSLYVTNLAIYVSFSLSQWRYDGIYALWF